MNKYIKNSGKTIHLYVERFKHRKDIFGGDTPSSEVLSGVVTVRPITFHPISGEITFHPILSPNSCFVLITPTSEFHPIFYSSYIQFTLTYCPIYDHNSSTPGPIFLKF